MKKQMGKFIIDTSITFVTRILQLVLGIGTSIIIARVLGPQGKGIYLLAILLPSLLVTFGNFGIGQASVFFVGKKKYSAGEILSNNIFISFLLGIISFLIGLIVVFFLGNFLFPGVAKVYLFSALFLIPLQFFLNFVSYLLLGLQKIKEFNLIGILQVFVLLILLLMFLLVFKLDIKTVIASNILSCSIGAIILFYLAKRITGTLYLSLNRSYLKDVFKYGFNVYLGNVIGFLHYRIDVFLINIFLNPIAVGFYSIATGLSEKIWLVSQSAGTVLFPKVSSETDKEKLKEFTPIVCRNVLLLTVLSAIPLFLLGRAIIIFLYSEKFLNSILPFQILLIGAVAMSGWRILANDLYGRGRPKLNIQVSLVSATLNVILNIFWIPLFGIAGAAWATTASYGVALLGTLFIYCRLSGNSWMKVILPQQSDWTLYLRTSLVLGRWMKAKVKRVLSQ